MASLPQNQMKSKPSYCLKEKIFTEIGCSVETERCQKKAEKLGLCNLHQRMRTCLHKIRIPDTLFSPDQKATTI